MNQIKKIFFLGILVFFQISCAGKPKIPLETAKVRIGQILASISSSGTVLPQNRLEIKPSVSGRVEEILVEEGEFVKKGATLAWLSSSERAALLDAARSQSPQEYAYWQEVYHPTPVMAPLNGFIIKKSVEPGQSVTTNDPLLVMADRLIVKAQVDETDIGLIKLKQKVEIVLDAFPDNKIESRVDHIAYESKTINNVTVYEIDILPKKVPSFFRAGMSATVSFLLEEKRDILVLPVKAVRRKNGNSFVFIKQKDKDIPKPVQIKTGLESSDEIEIVSGLLENDEVVIPTAKIIQETLDRQRQPRMFNPFSR